VDLLSRFYTYGAIWKGAPSPYLSSQFRGIGFSQNHANSDVLAWLGPEATGFGLALGGFGFWDPQAKP
jgi:hypothetical protein